MSQEVENKIKRRVWIIEIVLLLTLIAYVASTLIFHIFNVAAFQIILVTFLVLFQVVEIVLQPYWLSQLRELQPERKAAFQKMALCAVAGVICLSVFIFSMGEGSYQGFSSVGLYFALGYIVLNRVKHKQRKIFLGIDEDGNEESVIEEQEEQEDKDEV